MFDFDRGCSLGLDLGKILLPYSLEASTSLFLCNSDSYGCCTAESRLLHFLDRHDDLVELKDGVSLLEGWDGMEQ